MVALAPAPAPARAAQLAEACETQFAGTPEARDRCLDVAAAVELLHPEAGILLAGANPVLGTASPLGTRAGLPRFAIGGRVNVVGVELPDVFEPSPGARELLDFVVPLPHLDVAAGLYSGVPLLPGLRGFGALDALASASIIPAVSEIEETKVSWGVGGRFGLLEETFVLPAASVAVVYRDVPRLQMGSLDDGDEAEFGSDLRVWSVRLAASKSFLAFGVTAGIGWDRYRSDVDFRFVDPLLATTRTVFSRDDPALLDTERYSAFAEGRLTLTALHLVAQVGLQEHDARTLSDAVTRVESGGLFGGVGVRFGL